MLEYFAYVTIVVTCLRGILGFYIDVSKYLEERRHKKFQKKLREFQRQADKTARLEQAINRLSK